MRPSLRGPHSGLSQGVAGARGEPLARSLARPTGGSGPAGWRAGPRTGASTSAHTWGRDQPRLRGRGLWAGGRAGSGGAASERAGGQRAGLCVGGAGTSGSCSEARPPGGGRGHGERARAGGRAGLGGQAAALGGGAGARRPERRGQRAAVLAASGTPGPRDPGTGRRGSTPLPPPWEERGGPLAPGSTAGARTWGSRRCRGLRGRSRCGPGGGRAGEQIGLVTVPCGTFCARGQSAGTFCFRTESRPARRPGRRAPPLSPPCVSIEFHGPEGIWFRVS